MGQKAGGGMRGEKHLACTYSKKCIFSQDYDQRASVLSLHVCTYVRMYVCMYVRMYVCMFVCMYVCTYVCMYVCS